ncbi:MAG: linear amide C-N hydrolase [Bacteroidales bacterium]|nr:linear amide C-N hydrolase [Bacteroidales bacterium]
MRRIVILVVLTLIVNSVLACTCFSFMDKNGNIVFGRNFDFPVGEGHIEINKRNMRKIAFINSSEEKIVWISKFGSISFNQIGREFPYGGMNEAGLVIEQMWLEETQYPADDKRYPLTALQWIQYQLDNSANIQDIIGSDTLIRISNKSVARIHFLIADASGSVAVIEFIGGKMQIHQKDKLPFPALANCPYERSLKYKQTIEHHENIEFNDWTKTSSGRFVKATSMINNYDEKQNIIDYSFSILDSVAQGNGTQWSIVYDISKKKIFFKTRKNKHIQSLNFKDFDFSCSSPSIFLAVSDTVKNINSFHISNYKANYLLQKSVVSKVDFLKNTITNEMIEKTAKYAETVSCVGIE